MPKVQLAIPQVAPVMVLPNTLLFPHALMPLYIFEPRYRAMLQWSLEHDRVFCMALRKPGATETSSADDFYQTAGLGLVRACVGLDDGTSRLMLQGLCRVRFTGFRKTSPFFLAELEPLESSGIPREKSGPGFEKLMKLTDEVRALCYRFQELGAPVPEGIEAFLAKVDDPDMLADSVAHTFLRDALRRQDLMEEPNVRARLSALVKHLKDELNLLG